jgi:paired amphipathic helix protein Sin3a
MLNRTEAVSFVDNVKSQFENDPRKYERFLGIMRDLKGNMYVALMFWSFFFPIDAYLSYSSIGPGEVILQIAALFNGYPDLAREFNAFLPPGYLLHPRGEGKTSHILLSTPEGTTIWPQDYATRKRQ